jgi:Mlc titration factor MtfA (ptsG expression regulator)
MSNSQIINFAIFLLLVAVLGWRLFPKKKIRKTVVFPDAWRAILKDKVGFYNQLSDVEKIRFEEDVFQFLDNVRVTGVGTEADDTDYLLVAASAVIPLFGFPGWHYRSLNEVLLYESAFNEDFKTREAEERNILGMVGGTGMTGTMILSKPSLHRAFYDQHSSNHVGIHEFVHLLDRADGTTDGIPEMLLEQPFVIPWVKLMHQEIKDIREGDSQINPYGSTNEAEFFSVVSEYFFKQPDKLERKHPELYAMLERIFRQDLDGK